MTTPDDDTERYHKIKSDPSMALPTDSDWFHNWRKELKKDLEALRDDVSEIKVQMQENRIAVIKHDDQIISLAKDIAETDVEIMGHRARLHALEHSEVKRTERELSDTGSLATKVKDTAVMAGIAGLIGGFGMFLWFLLTLYVKAQGATP